MQLAGTQFTRTAAVFGNDISTLPDFPAEIRAPAGSLPGVSRLPDQLQLDRHPHAGRPARRARGHEPGRAQDEHRRPAAGRRPDRQHRRVHPGQPEQGGLRHQPADRRLAQGLHDLRDPDLDAQRAVARRARHDQQAEGPDQELLRPGRHVLAVRAEHGPDARLDRREVRRPAGRRRGQQARAQGRLRLRRDDRDVPHALPRHAGQAAAGHVPQHHRQRGHGARASWPREAGRPAAVLRLLPDHPGQRHPAPAVGLQGLRRQDVPGRGRDRGHRRGHRRELRRRARA